MTDLKHRLLPIIASLFLVPVFTSCGNAGTAAKASEEVLIPYGKVGDLVEMNSSRWLEVADIINPAMFGEYENRENARPQVPWFGEFPGKLLTSISYSYRMTKNPKLQTAGDRIVDEYERTQGEDGYLGSFKSIDRFSGLLGGGTWKNWDLWNHYHNILGLHSWYKQTGNRKAMQVAVKAADYIISVFAGRKYTDAGDIEMNLAISHGFMLLYNEPAILEFTDKAGRQKYYDEAKRIVDQEWPLEQAGDWYNAALAGTEFYQTRFHRWEVLHSLMTLGELYKADRVNNKTYFDAFEQIYWSILKTDVHNSGSFSTGEGACGNPYIAGIAPGYAGSIETCCTIAWAEMSALYLELSMDPYVADELELTTLSGGFSTLQPAANQALYTYDTPMNGMKEPAIKALHWQGMKGAPDVSCCQMNGPKIPGLIGLWGVLGTSEGVYLNYYGESLIKTATPGGQMIAIAEKTDYPVSGNVTLEISLDRPEQMSLNLRIPFWSHNTVVKVNGEKQEGVTARSYHKLERTFQSGDRIELQFDMTPHFWGGQDVMTGLASVYWGPVLLAHDEEVSGVKPDTRREFDLASIRNIRIVNSEKPGVWLEGAVTSKAGEEIFLCNFGSVGQHCGKLYHSWLKTAGVPVVQFERGGTPVWGATVK